MLTVKELLGGGGYGLRNMHCNIMVNGNAILLLLFAQYRNSRPIGSTSRILTESIKLESTDTVRLHRQRAHMVRPLLIVIDTIR